VLKPTVVTAGAMTRAVLEEIAKSATTPMAAKTRRPMSAFTIF
jgi:hypothetical protein